LHAPKATFLPVTAAFRGPCPNYTSKQDAVTTAYSEAAQIICDLPWRAGGERIHSNSHTKKFTTKGGISQVVTKYYLKAYPKRFG